MDLEQAILEAAKTHESFYLYDEAAIVSQCERLKAAFPDLTLLYSVKANPNPQILKTIFAQGIGADAASAGEVMLAQKLGLPETKIYYSAPGKTARDLAKAFGCAHLIADSLDEISRIEKIAAERNTHISIGLRINPDFSFTGETGLPSKFGVDEDAAFRFLRSFESRHVSVAGLHVHLKSQVLDAAALVRCHRKILALAERFEQETGIELSYVNLGSGIGVPYAPEDSPLDLEALGRETCAAIRAFRRKHPKVRFYLESGRFLVGPCGVYAAVVCDRKVSHGKTFVILRSTLGGFFRPSLARLLEAVAPDGGPMACEPLYTGKNAFTITAPGKTGTKREVVTLVGSLCTAADVIAEDIELPRLSVGDVVAVSNAGAYAAALSPMQFSSQDPPAQLVLDRFGKLVET